MKWFILIFIVGIVVSNYTRSQQAPIRDHRANVQRELLVQLDAVDTPAARQLVSDWRASYPTPSDESLEELRLVVERVKRDPAAAESMTLAAKQRHVRELPFEPVLGWGEQAPGL